MENLYITITRSVKDNTRCLDTRHTHMGVFVSELPLGVNNNSNYNKTYSSKHINVFIEESYTVHNVKKYVV